MDSKLNYMTPSQMALSCLSVSTDTARSDGGPGD